MPGKNEERFAYGAVLEALSRGLYPDQRHVLREFVQNAYDSTQELHRKYPRQPIQPIQVKIQPPSIFIADHGFGMSQTEVQQFRYLGFSQKERAKHAGFRGIGKYAGLAIAEKIIVDTSRFGDAYRYRLIIHADRMMAEAEQGKNRPLEQILQEHTEVSEAAAKADEHFTFVELQKLSKEADSLLEVEDIKTYLATTAPVPFDPEFPHAKNIQQKLRENVPDFLAVDVTVNGSYVYKPYFPSCGEPEFDPILHQDDKPEVLAYCWYCQNSEKGQLKPTDHAGVVFRVKNIAVGDGALARQMLWKGTPERAFYFFGEIHVLDPQVIPSSDRTVFEDNRARRRLAERGLRISSNLNRKAGAESAVRRFDEVLDKGIEMVSRRESQVNAGEVPVEIKDQIVYEVRQVQEDVQKRLKGPKTPRSVNRAKRLMGRTRRFLQKIKRSDEVFLDLRAELKFNGKLRVFYSAVVEVLREEFTQDPDRLERIIRKIHESIRSRFARP